MLDIKLIREQPEAVAAALARRGEDAAASLGRVLELDARRRALLPELEGLRAEQNDANARIRAATDEHEREQRVEVEEAFVRVPARRRERADGDREHQRRPLPHTQHHPEETRSAPVRRIAPRPDPGTEQTGDRVDRGDHDRAGHDGLRHARDIEPIDTM